MCLGDSLVTFNSNFSALDEKLCRVSTPVAGPGTEIVTEITEQEYGISKFSIKNSYAYGSKPDFVNAAAKQDNILMKDGTTIPVTTFPCITATGEIAPFITFSSMSLTNAAPKLSIFWTASGGTDLTLYATNSANPFKVSPIELNGTVTALCPAGEGNIFYVGGEFENVGDILSKKFCVVDLDKGEVYDSARGSVGAPGVNPFDGVADLESYGTVNVIKQYQTEKENLIIVGGSFQSLAAGRGLTIIDSWTGTKYPFYVNGTIHDMEIIGTNLYISGQFDYINYTAQSVSVISGLRVYTNGLAKISLAAITRFPNSSIDKSFAKNVLSLFTESSSIVNCISYKDAIIYVAGSFEVRSGGGTLIAKNIVSIDSEANLNTSWSPILIGEVFCLEIDGDYMYAGGNIKAYYTAAQYLSKPRPTDVRHACQNMAAFSIKVRSNPIHETNWKPQFNGFVTGITFHDQDFGSFVYCIGEFTTVNDQAAKYIAAVEKSYENNTRGETIFWRNTLQRPPARINHSLVCHNNYLLVGGNFTAVNQEYRLNLARFTRVDESLSAVQLSAVIWEVGAELCSEGTNLSLDLTSYITTSGFSNSYGYVNETVVTVDPVTFRGYSPGDIARFYVRRPVATDNFPFPVYLLGWKLDFNG